MALAVTVCIGGSYVTIQLYSRAREHSAVQQIGWIFMSAVAVGCSVWCTHFVAMLACRTEIPANCDPVLTLGSLLVVIAGSALAFHIAAMHQGRLGSALAGLVLGLSIAAMHYSGMAAYRIEGVVTWQPDYIAVSVVASIVFGTAFVIYLNAGHRWLALTMFILAVAALHFIGMAAVSVEPLLVDPLAANDADGLAVAITGGELRNAIELGQLELRYQAQTDFISNETIGYEALLRWNHPRRGWISPADFIPLAEETGLILPIGEWVLHTACTEAARWNSGLVAVNLSAV